MLGPLQVFLRSLLMDPAKQHLYLEYFSQENGGKAYYLDTQTNVSQWQKPIEPETVILSGIQVNEQMKQWLNSQEGQKVVANFNSSQNTSNSGFGAQQIQEQ